MFLLVHVCLMKITMLFFIGFPNNLFNSFSQKERTRILIQLESIYFVKLFKKSKNSVSLLYIYRDSNEFEYVSMHEFVKKMIFVYSQLKSTINAQHCKF